MQRRMSGLETSEGREGASGQGFARSLAARLSLGGRDHGGSCRIGDGDVGFGGSVVRLWIARN